MSTLTDWMNKCHELEAEIARLKDWNAERAGQCAATEQRLASRFAETNAENTFLRVKAQKLGCPYSNTHENGVCKSGYPGCACMDDLMALADFGSGDDIAALRRAHERIAVLENRFRWLHMGSSTDPDGYEWGIYRVKWENGVAVSVMNTLSDISDLDAEIAREEKAK